MSMFDTYVPCDKLKNIITRETGIKYFDWQTKSLECSLLSIDINEDLSVTLDGELYLDSDFSMIDDPYIYNGKLLLEFEYSKLKSLLFIRPEYHNVIAKIPDTLLEFDRKGKVTVTSIYDFDTITPALLKRNYLIELHSIS